MPEVFYRAFAQELLDNHWGDVASVLGLTASLLGFAFAIYNIVAARREFRKAINMVAGVDALMAILKIRSLMESSLEAYEASDWLKMQEAVGKARVVLVDIAGDRVIKNSRSIEHVKKVQTKIRDYHDILLRFHHNPNSRNPSGYRQMGSGLALTIEMARRIENEYRSQFLIKELFVWRWFRIALGWVGGRDQSGRADVVDSVNGGEVEQ